jgi:hypothetical protein
MDEGVNCRASHLKNLLFANSIIWSPFAVLLFVSPSDGGLKLIVLALNVCTLCVFVLGIHGAIQKSTVYLTLYITFSVFGSLACVLGFVLCYVFPMALSMVQTIVPLPDFMQRLLVWFGFTIWFINVIATGLALSLNNELTKIQARNDIESDSVTPLKTADQDPDPSSTPTPQLLFSLGPFASVSSDHPLVYIYIPQLYPYSANYGIHPQQ